MTATARRAAVAVRIPSDGTEMRETAIVVRDALRELGMKPPVEVDPLQPRSVPAAGGPVIEAAGPSVPGAGFGGDRDHDLLPDMGLA
jgi:hypothetical protein